MFDIHVRNITMGGKPFTIKHQKMSREASTGFQPH
tara:strand:+ start:397 stop:501 length:105 start_codon:yes stop_codon:yes gene_type:complete